jgi:hypothetical protein
VVPVQRHVQRRLALFLHRDRLEEQIARTTEGDATVLHLDERTTAFQDDLLCRRQVDLSIDAGKVDIFVRDERHRPILRLNLDRTLCRKNPGTELLREQ